MTDWRNEPLFEDDRKRVREEMAMQQAPNYKRPRAVHLRNEYLFKYEAALASSQERERRLEDILDGLIQWYKMDGSVGGASVAFEEAETLRAALHTEGET